MAASETYPLAWTDNGARRTLAEKLVRAAAGPTLSQKCVCVGVTIPDLQSLVRDYFDTAAQLSLSPQSSDIHFCDCVCDFARAEFSARASLRFEGCTFRYPLDLRGGRASIWFDACMPEALSGTNLAGLRFSRTESRNHLGICTAAGILPTIEMGRCEDIHFNCLLDDVLFDSATCSVTLTPHSNTHIHAKNGIFAVSPLRTGAKPITIVAENSTVVGDVSLNTVDKVQLLLKGCVIKGNIDIESAQQCSVELAESIVEGMLMARDSSFNEINRTFLLRGATIRGGLDLTHSRVNEIDVRYLTIYGHCKGVYDGDYVDLGKESGVGHLRCPTILDDTIEKLLSMWAALRRRTAPKPGHNPAGWRNLRWVAALRLTGASYIAFILIISYLSVALWFNRTVPAILERVLNSMYSPSVSSSLDGSSNSIAANQVLALHPHNLPIPPMLTMQSIAIFLMAIGATLFRWKCPEVVQEYSPTAWSREVGHPYTVYRLADASSPGWRLACWLLAGLGAGYTVIHVMVRFVTVLVQLF